MSVNSEAVGCTYRVGAECNSMARWGEGNGWLTRHFLSEQTKAALLTGRPFTLEPQSPVFGRRTGAVMQYTAPQNPSAPRTGLTLMRPHACTHISSPRWLDFFVPVCCCVWKGFSFLLLWMLLWIVGLGWDYSGLYGERIECRSSYRVPVSVSTVQLGLLFVCKWDLISCKAVMLFFCFVFFYLSCWVQPHWEILHGPQIKIKKKMLSFMCHHNSFMQYLF